MGKPLKAIPQITVDDKKISTVLDALKYVIDVREGRGTADKGKMWVTFDDLWDALKNINTSTGSGIFSEEFEAGEILEAGNFVGIFKDTEDEDTLKLRKACGLVDDENQFKPCNGYILKNYAKGAKATVYYSGINTAFSGFDSLEPGSIVYISDTAGGVSQTRKTGAKIQMVGMVVKSGIFFVPGDVVPDCCGGACTHYGDTSNCDAPGGIINPEMIADTSGLSDEVSDKIFDTIGAAIVYAGTGEGVSLINRGDIILDFAAEDPDCSEAMYMLGVTAV